MPNDESFRVGLMTEQVRVALFKKNNGLPSRVIESLKAVRRLIL